MNNCENLFFIMNSIQLTNLILIYKDCDIIEIGYIIIMKIIEVPDTAVN